MKYCWTLLALFAFVLVGCAGQGNHGNQEPQKHFLWKVSDENSSVWLLGSVHFADSSFYPLPGVIQGAFNESTELGVELDVSDDSVSSEITKGYIQKGMLPRGERLNSIVSQRTWMQVDSLATVWNFPSAGFLQMRPWFVAVTLSSIAVSRAGIVPEYGVDIVLLDSAKKRGMPIVALESVDDQIAPFADAANNDSLGLYYLENTLNEIQNLDSMITRLVRAWKTGDEKLLEEVLDDKGLAESSNEAYDKQMEEMLYTNRNLKMAESIEKFLKDDRKIFVVVGAAHLAFGESNVVELLKKKGFTVERF